MSRQINIDEKLSPEDHEYFRGRWDVTSLRRNMTNLGVSPSAAIRAEFMTYDEYAAHVADAENAPEPETGPEANPNAGTGSTPIPASASQQQEQGVGLGAQGNGSTDPTPYVEGPRAFADAELAGKSYDKWTAEQLKAEVAKRNELREGHELYADDEPMSADGVKADLVKRLQDDDEADAPE